MDHPYPWLRYIDASDVDNQTIDFDGLKVRNDAKEKLGDVDGFIVDSDSGRPYYVVVDSGGWFKSKHFLLPVGHARIDDDNDALVTDLSRDRVDRFPGFDKNEFDKLTENDVRRMNNDICTVCSVSTITYSESEPYAEAWNRPQYQQPTWWNTMPLNPDRMGDRVYENAVEYPPSGAEPRAGRERITAREPTRDERRDEKRDDARVGDVSPHHDGRAQPGDVVGIETGGEQTHVGETAADENQRRRDAEKAAKK